ncbi:hypothetical protein Tco_1041403 [Tanacetum coccineum]|uniref:Uncharacterized protein n=1 Tax=Tanacetum coccineum TaxID=301880 RepID=A0ABQ5GIN4_9ASTR
MTKNKHALRGCYTPFVAVIRETNAPSVLLPPPDAPSRRLSRWCLAWVEVTVRSGDDGSGGVDDDYDDDNDGGGVAVVG